MLQLQILATHFLNPDVDPYQNTGKWLNNYINSQNKGQWLGSYVHKQSEYGLVFT